jgi:hypothetical protein
MSRFSELDILTRFMEKGCRGPYTRGFELSKYGHESTDEMRVTDD